MRPDQMFVDDLSTENLSKTVVKKCSEIICKKSISSLFRKPQDDLTEQLESEPFAIEKCIEPQELSSRNEATL